MKPGEFGHALQLRIDKENRSDAVSNKEEEELGLAKKMIADQKATSAQLEREMEKMRADNAMGQVRSVQLEMELEEFKNLFANLEIKNKALVAEVTRAKAETEAVKKDKARSEDLAASRVLQELRESVERAERSQSLAERTLADYESLERLYAELKKSCAALKENADKKK